ncbi:TPA: hypothetical protein ACH3X2_012119 [Trebouxia sp. C0005]
MQVAANIASDNQQTAKPVTSAGTPQQQQLDSTARMCTQQYRLPETAADNLLPPASTTASSQNKATAEQKTQQLQQADPPQTSVSMKSHFDVRFPVQASTKQDSAHRAPELKQAPTKREKIQCLFCTKPARITCLHKLCKKCCNERHPNDCKAHDSVGPVGDRDKLKQARVQALTAKASHATVPASTLDPKTSLADTKGPGQCLPHNPYHFCKSAVMPACKIGSVASHIVCFSVTEYESHII